MVRFLASDFAYSFEIKCLSKKYPLHVNGVAYFLKDEAVSLSSRSIISISSESFFFLLPPAAPESIVNQSSVGVQPMEEVKVY